MPVDISNVLHVLAHELRTPVGIAHGYVRLLLEDRLSQEADRRRALEQMQKALGRLSELSHESTALASWFERETTPPLHVEARTLLDQVAAAEYSAPVEIDTAVLDQAAVPTSDAGALTAALITMVRATARELRNQTCLVTARIDDTALEMLAGPSEQLPALRAARASNAAEAIALERGGLGLALVHAAVVLDTHGAERWTVNGSRQTIGIRLPLGERPLP